MPTLRKLAVALMQFENQFRTDLGEDDAAYIHRIIRVHRALELSARATLMASIFP